MLLLPGTDAAWAGANGEVGTVTVNPSGSWRSGDFRSSYLFFERGEWKEPYLVPDRGHCMESGFRIFDINLQPSWRMEMDAKGKMSI